jgi:type II secretory pathway predicted ATPase ExeA/DNA polymerase III psi subunit
VGKTFFIHALIGHLDEKITPILVLNPVLTFRDLLDQILLVLNQPAREETETALFHRFTGLLDQMMAHDQTLLIILDEAQDLNDRTLEGIERFLDLRSKLIKVIFVGQPHFDERPNSMSLGGLRQMIKTKQKIKPFTEEESRGYIDHRLRVVGSSSEIITPEAISRICSYTHGVSSSINHVCDNALWVGCTMKREKIDVDIIERVIQKLEGPRIQQKILPAIQPIRQIWKSPIRSAASFKRVSMAILLLACLGGLIFLLYEYIGHGSMKIREIRSFIGSKLAIKPFTPKPSAEGTIESIMKRDRIPTSDEPILTQPEPSSLQREAVLLTPGKGKEPLTEVIAVKRGETLFLLAKNYYHLTNPTLIDIILQHNLEITNVDLIKVNQKIKVPKITEESLIIQSPDHTFKIHAGTFWSSELSKPYRDESALKGKIIEVIPLKVSPNEIWYRVLVGNFQSREEALNMVLFLKKKGLLPSLGYGFKKD